MYIIRIIKIVIVDYPVDCITNLCNGTPPTVGLSTTTSTSTTTS